MEQEYEAVNPGGAVDIKKNVGKKYSGEYVGSKKIRTELGEQFIYELESEDGSKYGVFGFADLNRKMEAVAIGTPVRITYTGQSKIKNKYGKFPHQCLVERAKHAANGHDQEETGLDEAETVDA